MESKEVGKCGLMFYNCLFMLLPATAVFLITEDIFDIFGDYGQSFYQIVINEAAEFEGWSDTWFLLCFFLSCVFGFILMFSIVLCTAYNSALTTTIVGCLKNIVITYYGILVGGDYQYSVLNFAGLNISVVGSIIYLISSTKKSTERKDLT